MTYQTPLAATVRLYDRLLDSLPWQELAARFCCLMVQPRDEWARIEASPARVRDTSVPYVIILALFGPVIHFGATLGMILFGPLSFSLVGFIGSVLMVGVGAGLNLLIVYGLVQLIHGVALKYDKAVDDLAAFNIAIYGLTAFFLSQGLGQLPQMGGVAVIIGLYSLYQLYLGTDRLLEVDPADQPSVNLMVPGLALAFYLAMIGVAGLIVWFAR